MAENIPNTPAGAVPPKPSESAKVQPKKETVRINLPPKPTAAPTIKIPAPSAGATPAPAAPVAVATATAAAAPAPTAAHAPAPRPAPATMPRQTQMSRSVPVVSGVSGVDKGLAIVAMLVALAVVGHVAWLSFR